MVDFLYILMVIVIGSLLIRLFWPFISVIGTVILILIGVSLIVGYFERKKRMRNIRDFEDEINREFQNNNDGYENKRTYGSNNSRNDDVIDVEYTEREVDDNK